MPIQKGASGTQTWERNLDPLEGPKTQNYFKHASTSYQKRVFERALRIETVVSRRRRAIIFRNVRFVEKAWGGVHRIV